MPRDHQAQYYRSPRFTHPRKDYKKTEGAKIEENLALKIESFFKVIKDKVIFWKN